MTINVPKQPPLAGDLRKPFAGQIAELRQFSAVGAPSRARSRRTGFYEVQGLANTYTCSSSTGSSAPPERRDQGAGPGRSVRGCKGLVQFPELVETVSSTWRKEP